MKEYKINLNLSLTDIRIIFSEYEFQIMSGERIYFSKRLMLSDILKQLPKEDKREMYTSYPKVIEVLVNAGNIIRPTLWESFENTIEKYDDALRKMED